MEFTVKRSLPLEEGGGTANISVFEHIPEFQHRLRYFGYQLKGKLEGAEDDSVIRISTLTPATVYNFLGLLTDSRGQEIVFKKIDNVVTAFLFATAIEDSEFQQKLIMRIHDLVCQHHAMPEIHKVLYDKLLKKVIWAWEEQTEGRVGLRNIFTMCFAFVSTYPGMTIKMQPAPKKEKNEKKKSKDSNARLQELPPLLGLNALKDMREKVGHMDWWKFELLPDFTDKCLELASYNTENRGLKEDGQWSIVPVHRLIPVLVSYDLTGE